MSPFTTPRPPRPERRRHARLEVDTPAHLRGGTSPVEGRIENLSLLGASFLAAGDAPAVPEGARVTLNVPGGAPDGRDASWHGTVVRVEDLHDAEGAWVAYAVEFDRPIEG